MAKGKKITIGFISSLAWLVLLVAVLTTTANLIVGGLSHVGGSASAVVKSFAQSESAISSLIDEIEKGVEPKVAKEIEKNRATIETALSSLGESLKFRGSLENTLNEIAAAVLNGSDSAKVDFSDLINQVVAQINEAAKTIVISKKDFKGVVPTTLNLRKQSKTIVKIRTALHLALLIWLLWFGLLGVLFILKGRRAIQTVGLQIFSIGILAVLVHLALPFALKWDTEYSGFTDYQVKLGSDAISRLSSPAFMVGIVCAFFGLVISLMPRVLARERLPRPPT